MSALPIGYEGVKPVEPTVGEAIVNCRHSLANYMLLDVRRFGAVVQVFYRDADMVSVRMFTQNCQNIDRAKDYVAFIRRIEATI